MHNGQPVVSNQKTVYNYPPNVRVIRNEPVIIKREPVIVKAPSNQVGSILK